LVYGGCTLWLAHWFTVAPGDWFRLMREQSRPSPRQGVTVQCRNKRHKLPTNRREANFFVFWADISPRDVEFVVPAGRQKREIGVANVWELPIFEDHVPRLVMNQASTRPPPNEG
jgi:hypothetical protein